MTLRIKYAGVALASMIWGAGGAATAAVAAECGAMRINAANTDGITNRAACGGDAGLLGNGAIMIAPGGYLELRMPATGRATTRLRCENNATTDWKLNTASAPTWNGAIGASGCTWHGQRLACGRPAVACVAEIMQAVRQTVAIHAMVQVKEWRIDGDAAAAQRLRDDSATVVQRLREWVDLQGPVREYCRVQAGLETALELHLTVSAAGQVAVESAPITPPAPAPASLWFTNCMRERLARHPAPHGQPHAYAIDWLVEPP